MSEDYSVVPALVDDFLIELDPVGWVAPEGFPAGLRPAGLFAQGVAGGLEVVLVESPGRPAAGVGLPPRSWRVG